jgi:hypothetical protein
MSGSTRPRRPLSEELRRRLLQLPDLSEADRAALNHLFDQRCYSLVWEDKPEAVEETLRASCPPSPKYLNARCCLLPLPGG